jgi:S-(hydroxymethyl)glutathione dehydrogenase / alcohol dehydrogenase
VAVFGLGAVGLAVIEAAKGAGAKAIYGIDMNPAKKAVATKFGATHFVNPADYPGQAIQVPYSLLFTLAVAPWSWWWLPFRTCWSR